MHVDGAPRHRPFDAEGRRLRPGDRVRVVGVPDLSAMAPAPRREAMAAFRHLVGTYRVISAFDEHGFAELWFVIRAGRYKGRHWVVIEPSLLRLPTRRGASHFANREDP